MRTLLVPAGLAAAITLALTPSAPTAAAVAVTAPAFAVTAAAGTTGTAGTGQAVRFWGYWQDKKSSWAFATTGPAQAKPDDGAVEGWRYAESSGESGVPPRAKPDFEKICGSERAEQGRKRVAVVIDYGDRSDAPQGQSEGPPAAKTGCAVVDSAATGADVLAAVGRPQTDGKGLVCAIDTYPAGACGPAAGAGAPSARAGGGSGSEGRAGSGADNRSGGSSLGLVGGVVVVLVVAAAGVWLAVRRRRTPGAPGR